MPLSHFYPTILPTPPKTIQEQRRKTNKTSTETKDKLRHFNCNTKYIIIIIVHKNDGTS